MGRFVFDLVVGEAQWGETGGGVGLEAEGIAGLGRRGAVIAPAIGLDDEAEIGPEEVDLELVDHLFGQRDRKAGGGGNRPEEPFQLVIREPEGVLVEDLAKDPHARLARVVIERPAQCVSVDHVQLVRLVDRPLNGLRTRDSGEVEESADGLSHWDAEAVSDIAVP